MFFKRKEKILKSEDENLRVSKKMRPGQSLGLQCGVIIDDDDDGRWERLGDERVWKLQTHTYSSLFPRTPTHQIPQLQHTISASTRRKLHFDVVFLWIFFLSAADWFSLIHFCRRVSLFFLLFLDVEDWFLRCSWCCWFVVEIFGCRFYNLSCY